MKLNDIKKELIKISFLDPEECLKELKTLIQKIDSPKIRKVIRGNYAYFYLVEFYFNKRAKEKILDKGRIELSLYNQDKDIINKMNWNVLSKILKKYD